MLSIVIPTLNESKTGYLQKILRAYDGVADCEILCVDGGSVDDTQNIIKHSSANLVETDIASRAGRLNEGTRQASFDMVLLHHPRSVLDIKGIESLIQQCESLQWGAFTHKFNTSHPLLTFTSWYSNHIRGDIRKVYYLDHCLFAKKQLLLDVGLIPDIDIFEDTEICLRLKKKASPKRLPYISETSAVRFQTNGIFRQVLKNQYMKWRYYLDSSDKEMNQLYEKGIELNTQYKKKD